MNTSNVEEISPLISKSGIPAAVRDTRKTYQKQLAMYFILASTIFERIAFDVLAGTLAITADSENCPSTRGPLVALFFTGISNISSLIFAVLSDAKLGRAKTILVGFILYFIGYLLTTLFMSNAVTKACYDIPDTQTIFVKPCVQWMFPALIIIAMGAGAVQSNMAVFGAEQIQDPKITSRYFNKYVFAVNIGAILAKVAFPFTQETKSNYYIAYTYGTSVLFIAGLLFIIGHRYYIHVKPYDSVATKCIPVTINAIWTWYQHKRQQHSDNGKYTPSVQPYFRNTRRNTIDEEDVIRQDQRSLSFLDYAKAVNKGKYIDRIVDDVKSLRGALLVFILLIPYWLIYDQLNSTFRLQAKRMRETDPGSMVVVSLADPFILIIGILILNLYVYKYLDAHKKPLTIQLKFMIGMFFGILTMFIAGAIEIVRRDQWEQNQTLSNLTIYHQIPQGITMGLSELFVMVASFEYAYFAASRSAQTLIMSLRFFFLGISSFIGTIYIAVFAHFSPDFDFTCQLNPSINSIYGIYFFILANLQFVFLIIFFICQKKFQIIKLNRQQMETGHFMPRSYSASFIRQ